MRCNKFQGAILLILQPKLYLLQKKKNPKLYPCMFPSMEVISKESMSFPVTQKHGNNVSIKEIYL